MKPSILKEIQDSLLIEDSVKQQIIDQWDQLSSEQQEVIEQYVVIGSDVQGNLYQKAIDNNPKLEQGIKQIIQNYQTKTFASMGSESESADALLYDI